MIGNCIGPGVDENGERKPMDWLSMPRFQGWAILDPDGWRDGTWEQPVTIQEFERRLMQCTLQIDAPAALLACPPSVDPLMIPAGPVIAAERKRLRDEQVQAVLDAARRYAKWAHDSGDYPHDETGCEAHDAILKAVSALADPQVPREAGD
jgi:hypothetical protein